MNKYSFKSFKNTSFTKEDPKDFEGEIIGACFHNDVPFSNVFPEGIKTTFIRCNLDNCNIPESATVIGGTNKHFLEQNDGEYWVVDKELKPVSPRDTKKFDDCKLSKLAADIPSVKLAEPVTTTNDPRKIERDKIEALKNNDAELKSYLIAKGDLQPASDLQAVK